MDRVGVSFPTTMNNTDKWFKTCQCQWQAVVTSGDSETVKCIRWRHKAFVREFELCEM